MNESRGETGGGDPLFREEAVRDYVRARSRGDLLRISPAWTGWAFRVLIAGALAALGFASLAEIDDWVGGPAVVRMAGRESDDDGERGGREVVALLPATDRRLLAVGQPLLLRLAAHGNAVELRVTSIDPAVFGPADAAGRLGRSAELVTIAGPVVFVRAALASEEPDLLVPGATGRAEVRVGRHKLIRTILPGGRP